MHKVRGPGDVCHLHKVYAPERWDLAAPVRAHVARKLHPGSAGDGLSGPRLGVKHVSVCHLNMVRNCGPPGTHTKRHIGHGGQVLWEQYTVVV